MAYTPTTWQTGDTITAALLNKMEQGIASAGGALIATLSNGVLNKTWAEINAAVPLVWVYDDGSYWGCIACFGDDGEYGCGFADYSSDSPVAHWFITDSENGYPTISE